MVKRICPQCRSKRFRKNSVGNYICESGHVYAGYHEEEGEFDASGTLSYRRTKKTKRKRELTTSRGKLTSTLEGKEDELLFVKAIQLILRHQLWWLIHEKKCPKEIEAVAGEIWRALAVDFKNYQDKDLGITPSAPSASKQPPRGSTKSHDSQTIVDTDGEMFSIDPITSRSRPRNPRTQTKQSSNVEEDEEEDTLDAMKEFQENNSESSSESESEDDNEHNESSEDEVGPPVSGNRSSKSSHLYTIFSARKPSMLMTVVVCYLSSVHMKLPFIAGDFFRWMMTNQFPYYYIFEFLPASMIRNFGNYSRKKLIPHRVQSVEFLHRATYMVATRLQNGPSKIVHSAPNNSILIYRFIHQLMLPVELYPCATQILNFVLKESDKNKSPVTWRQTPVVQRNKATSSTIRAMAIVIILAKLVFGLDGKKSLPDGHSWIRTMDIYDGLLAQTTIPSALGELEELIQVNPDLYSNFCKTTLKNIPEEQYKQLTRLFEGTEYSKKEHELDGSGARWVPSMEEFIRYLYMSVPAPQPLQDNGSRPAPLKPGQGYVCYQEDSSSTFLGS
ncbi:Pol I core factor CF, partial [Podila epigama]